MKLLYKKNKIDSTFLRKMGIKLKKKIVLYIIVPTE